MWTDQFGYFLMLLTMAMMLRASFELQNHTSASEAALLAATVPDTEEWAEKRKEWSRKAIEGYARAQEEK